MLYKNMTPVMKADRSLILERVALIDTNMTKKDEKTAAFTKKNFVMM